jgi:hypothetical protein
LQQQQLDNHAPARAQSSHQVKGSFDKTCQQGTHQQGVGSNKVEDRQYLTFTGRRIAAIVRKHNECASFKGDCFDLE